MGRIAKGGLVVIRSVFWIAGIYAICYGLRLGFMTGPRLWADSAWTLPSAQGFTFVCAGLPLAVKADWLFGKGRWLALAASVVLWLGPSWLPGNHDHDYLLRLFATLAATLTMLVWRTLWRLTQPAH